ncbi:MULTISPECIES: hypothetical protein [Idiomarina]|uniref:hypothetical protein n=1 Tax=Idiomarinaceae TaxID=267893 RepID=UPI00129CDA8C|nr:MULTISPECIES: hypothetical protein [Idiomarina]MRJ43316.1 hypothetical protein [Idiomarina sp. FeN1]NCU58833.1 hypothetical protein [Idiomarina sp. FenA--70]NCU61538.1 hypothetical protein [Idiomarina sp. FenBw--71]UUN14034.1 hypothetical protein KGF88_02055 [Idiomarina loihiensis]
MLKFISLFITILVITACAQQVRLGSGHVLRIYESEIEINSWYRNNEEKILISNLKHIRLDSLFSINAENYNLSFYSTRAISECFKTEDSLETKVASLISEQFSPLLNGHSLHVNFLPKSNFDIVSKKRVDSPDPLAFVFPVDISKECSQSLIASAFKDTIRTIVHELFHLHTYKNKLPFSNLEGEVLAYQAEYCNNVFAANTTHFYLNEDGQTTPQKLNSSSISIQASYIFQDFLEDTYNRVYSLTDVSEQDKVSLMIQEVCNSVTQMVY